MVIKLHISPSALTEDFVLKVWEAANDGVGAEVHEEDIVAPHDEPVTITVNGLDKVVHVVRLYGKDSANLLHEYNAEPTTDVITLFTPIRFKIGDGEVGTPAAGTSNYTNEVLAGLENNDYLVFRTGYGALIPDVHYTNEPDPGGFSLAQEFDVFNGDPGEEFLIIRQPKAVTTVVNDSVVGKWFGGFLDIAANTSFEAAHLRKLIRFSGTCDYSFDVNPPIGYGFCFQHFGVTGTCKVKFNNAQLLWNGTPKAELEIPTFTEACFVFDGDNWNVVYFSQIIDVPDNSYPIVGMGNYSVGDVPGSNPVYVITHNLDITGDYNVFFSIKTKVGSEANYHKNNTITGTWWHDTVEAQKKNRFYISLEQLTNEIQSVDIAWFIVKI